jgi:hypothetical protein
MPQIRYCQDVPMKKITFFALPFFFLYTAVALPVESSRESNGAALFNKHCSGCHHNARKIKADVNILEFMRNPVAFMPRFDRDKINDRDAQAIVDFIRHGARDIGKVPEPLVTSNVPVINNSTSVTVEPRKKLIADNAINDDPVPVPIKPTKNIKSWDPRFVKKWTIKGIQNCEVETLQSFEITSNANHELAVVPLMKPADYTVEVTAVEIIDKTLKLQFTSIWKYSSSLRTIETLELTISDDGEKMSGNYKVHASSSTGLGRNVWAE